MADELEELEQMAKIAEIYGHAPGSRWWKERAKLISDKYRIRAKEEAGRGGVDQQPASRSRMTIKWVTDTHYGVAIKESNWDAAIAKAKAEHLDAKDWEQDAPRGGKCKLDGEEYEFKRFKASWCGDKDTPFRIRVVKKGAGLFIAQVCLVGRVGRALVH